MTATVEEKVLKLHRADVVAMLEDVGLKLAANWTDAELAERCQRHLLEKDLELVDGESKELLDKVLSANEAKIPIEVYSDEAAADETPAPAPEAQPEEESVEATAPVKKRGRPAGTKNTKTKPTKPVSKRQGMSMLDAAGVVLAKAKDSKPHSCKELIEEMAKKKLWVSPGGATPHQTLAAGLVTEISKKGNQSRFKKVAPGQFALTAFGKKHVEA